MIILHKSLNKIKFINILFEITLIIIIANFKIITASSKQLIISRKNGIKIH